MRGFAAAVACMCGGCLFGPDLPPVSCGAANQCPDGLVCKVTTRECVEPSQLTDPDAAVPLIDATPLCLEFEATHFDACAIPEPLGPLALPATGISKLDTDSRAFVDPNDVPIDAATGVVDLVDGEALVLSVEDLTVPVNAGLVGVGSRPLIIAVWGTATISGRVSVSSSQISSGAGYDPARCRGGPAGAGGIGSTNNGGGGEAARSAAPVGAAVTATAAT